MAPSLCEVAVNLFFLAISHTRFAYGSNSTSCCNSTYIHADDTYILSEVAASLGGNLDWNNETACWTGVYCDASGHVLTLDLPYNALNGAIPSILGNLTTLTQLDLSYNTLDESIPSELGNLTNLQSLNLSHNAISGSIPCSLGNLKSLTALILSNNMLSGSIPSCLENLTNLVDLFLEINQLSGSIPSGLGTLSNLKRLDLSENDFGSAIPSTFDGLTSLKTLYFVSSNLTGSIPSSLESLQNLLELDLSNNSLEGSIPSSLGNLTQLQKLNLAVNKLNGSIPSSLGSLENLVQLVLYSNQLSGTIPESVEQLCTQVNVVGFSNNCFTLSNNQSNCTGANETVSCSATSPSSARVLVVAILASVASLAVILTFLAILFCILRRQRRDLELTRLSTLDNQLRSHFVRSIPLADVLAATNNLSEGNIIGKGGFGTVYKGVAEDGSLWAVKRGNPSDPASPSVFTNEVDIICRMSHTNILSLKAYCLEGGEQILIYAFMHNGSLKDWIHDSYKPPLSLEQRVSIAIGAAEGLHYLHHLAKPTIIHRDVKSDNILLDDKMQALVADFGFVQGSDADYASTEGDRLSVVGTPGYVDPEYVRTMVASSKSDVYSFGVVLLELITGLPATLEGEPGGDRESLVMHVARTLQWDASRMIDVRLHGSFDEEAVVAFIGIARRCVVRNREERPSMREIVGALFNVGELLESEKVSRPVWTDDDDDYDDIKLNNSTDQSSSYMMSDMSASRSWWFKR